MKISDVYGKVELNNGVEMPYLGLGVYKSQSGQELTEAIASAYEFGYRHIDTASVYKNEEGVGQAIKDLSISREELFITSKVWNDDQGYQSTLNAFQRSMDNLQTDYLDLYLIHWPIPELLSDTWQAIEEIYRSGKVKAIGVSNFLEHHLQSIMNDFDIVPAVNQIEFHPHLVQQNLLDFCFNNLIQPIAWRPIMKGEVRDIPILQQLAEKYAKSPVQIVLRWDLQKGVMTIPKSVTRHRIAENAAIFDFELSATEIVSIDALNQDHRLGAHPDLLDF